MFFKKDSHGDRKKPTVVIVGANFAGLNAAGHLGTECEVVVFDPQPNFEFSPNVNEILSGLKSENDVRLNRKQIVERLGHTFIQDDVIEIDTSDRHVTGHHGRCIKYDALIVAAGTLNNTFGVQGAESYSVPYRKSGLVSTIKRSIDRAVADGGDYIVSLIGGGPKGVEATGEILRTYRDKPNIHLQIIELAGRLLAREPEVLDGEIRRLCSDMGVDIHTGVPAEKIEPSDLWLADGTHLKTDLTIWTGGIAPPRILHDSGLAEQPGEWAPVRWTLQSKFHDDVFIAGDAAQTPDPVRKQAYHALDMGETAAKNALHLLKGERLHDFKPSNKPMIISFGDIEVFMIWNGRVYAGLALAPVKEMIYQYNMALLDPPTEAGPMQEFLERVSTGFGKKFLPAISSFDYLSRLPQLRLVESAD